MPSSFVSSYTVQSCFTSMEGNRECTVYCIWPACQQPCAMLLCQITLGHFQMHCVCDCLQCSQSCASGILAGLHSLAGHASLAQEGAFEAHTQPCALQERAVCRA